MNLFGNVGSLELVVVLVLAILVLGPKRVLEFVQSIRRLAARLREMSGDFTSMLRDETQAGEENGGGEAGEPLRDTIQQSLGPLKELQSELQSATQATRQAIGGFVSQDLAPAAGDVGAGLQDVAQEAQQALDEIAGSAPAAEEGHDEPAE